MKRFICIAVLFLFSVSLFAEDILSESFDGNSSLTGWTLADSNTAYYTGGTKIGSGAMRVRASSSATRTVSTAGYQTITFAFKLAAYSLESGETITAQYNTGSGWVDAGSIGDGQDNSTYNTFSVSLPAAADNNSSLQIRFVGNGNSTADYGYVEDVVVSGTVIPTGGTAFFTESFDGNTDLSGWTLSDANASYYTGSTKNGTAALRLRYTASATRTVSTVGQENISVSFSMAGYSLESGETVAMEYNTGSGWVTAKTLGDGEDNSTYKSYTVTLPAAAANNPSFQIRFKITSSSTADYGYIDDVQVLGTAIVPVASSRSGMGAIPYSGGVTFRVWAPNASAVSVAGDFNSWTAGMNALASEGNGYWSTDVSGAVADQQYKYVITYSGSQLWKNDPYAREVTSSVGNSIIKDRSYTWSSFSMPSWGEMVIYELHVRTWNGTFAGVAAKAGYLKDTLAVNAVEIMPVHEFPGDQSWGYNPAHLFAVESCYGGYSGYKDMVNTLHQNGIAVIQDIVHNHYGPSDLDLWCFDGPDYGNGGIYFFTDYRKSTPWGDTRPDYGRSEVRSFIKDNAIYWLEEMQADGLRWDATVYIRKTAYDGTDIADGYSLLQWVHNEKNSKFSWKFSIAEDLQNNDYVTKTTGEGGAGFDSQWDANFLHNMRDQMKLGNDSDRDMSVISGIISKIDNGNPTCLVKYSESHDECAGVNGKQRLTQDIDNYDARSYWAKKRAGLALLTAILSPGVPMIFQGQENLETGNWSDSGSFSWDDTTTYAGYVQMIRDAIRLKRNWYNNTRGLSGNNINVFHVNNTGKVIAFHRWKDGGDGDDVLVIINFSNTQYSSYNLGAPSAGTWYCRYNSDYNGYDSGFGNFGGYNTTAYSGSKDGLGNNMNVGLGGYSVTIYSK